MSWPSALASIGILVLTPVEFELPVSEIYGATRGPLESETTLEVEPLDLFSESLRQDVVRTCAGKPACFLEKFRGTGASVDLVLVVSVTDLESQWLIGGRVISAEGEDLARAGAESDKAAPLDVAMRRLLSELLPPSIWGRVAALSATSEPSGARLSLGSRTCLTPCRLERLPSGPHRILLEKSGHLPREIELVLAPKETTRIAETLEPVSEEASIWESPWLWAGIGAVVVGAGVGAFFILRADPKDEVCVPAMDCLR